MPSRTHKNDERQTLNGRPIRRAGMNARGMFPGRSADASVPFTAFHRNALMFVQRAFDVCARGTMLPQIR